MLDLGSISEYQKTRVPLWDGQWKSHTVFKASVSGVNGRVFRTRLPRLEIKSIISLMLSESRRRCDIKGGGETQSYQVNNDEKCNILQITGQQKYIQCCSKVYTPPPPLQNLWIILTKRIIQNACHFYLGLSWIRYFT